MNEIYINVMINDFGNGRVRCAMTQQVNDGKLDVQHIDKAKAQRLMWELVLAGGKREVYVNQFDRNIVTSQAWIFLPN